MSTMGFKVRVDFLTGVRHCLRGTDSSVMTPDPLATSMVAEPFTDPSTCTCIITGIIK